MFPIIRFLTNLYFCTRFCGTDLKITSNWVYQMAFYVQSSNNVLHVYARERGKALFTLNKRLFVFCEIEIKDLL